MTVVWVFTEKHRGIPLVSSILAQGWARAGSTPAHDHEDSDMPVMKKKPPAELNRPKTIGIVGSRRRDSDADYLACVGRFGELYQTGDRIVSGGCPQGGDRFAEEIAETHGITITIHYPRREQLDAGLMAMNRRAAYAVINYARNTLIAGDADVLIALCADDRTGGTEDTVKKAIKLGKVVVYA